MSDYRIFSLSENAVTICFGNRISAEINDQIIGLSRFLEENPFEGFIETVPAYSALTVFFDISAVRKKYPGYPTAFSAVGGILENAVAQITHRESEKPRTIEIPVSFEEADAPDLERLLIDKNLSKSEFVEIFTSSVYRVFMLGFLPGFAYMGEVNERIAAPRKTAPRLRVPPGSVGIAGRQTGIYPLESPGGWQIVGRTEKKLFTPFENEPALLQPGDLVKFTSIENQ